MLAASLFLLLWYGAVGLFFRRRVRRGSGEDTLPLPHGWQDRVDDLSEVMGKPVLDRGVSVVEADEISFGSADLAQDQEDQLGLIPDVQQEIKSICVMLAEQDGTKEHFFSMFELIRDKYPKLAGSPVVGNLNGFLREHVPFHLSDEELESLWS